MMNKTKIAITLQENSVKQLDHLIRKNMFSNRSQAIQEAVKEKLERIERSRLARECAKLDPNFEKAMAEEGLTGDLGEWPEY
jgi:metal-responsive CopG/Arc/MetJ family transcriptional regulator